MAWLTVKVLTVRLEKRVLQSNHFRRKPRAPLRRGRRVGLAGTQNRRPRWPEVAEPRREAAAPHQRSTAALGRISVAAELPSDLSTSLGWSLPAVALGLVVAVVDPTSRSEEVEREMVKRGGTKLKGESERD